MSREKVLTINLSFPHTQGKTRQLALSKIDLEFIIARYYSDLAGGKNRQLRSWNVRAWEVSLIKRKRKASP